MTSEVGHFIRRAMVAPKTGSAPVPSSYMLALFNIDAENDIEWIALFSAPTREGARP